MSDLNGLPLAAARGPLEADDISKTVEGRTLWAGLSLRLAPGSTTALVGPSGAGKTTLLNCLGLLEPVSSGALRYAGVDVTGARGARRRRLFRESFGFMFQGFGLVEQWSVLDNLVVPLHGSRISRRERDGQAERALDVVGLGGRGDDRVHVLSGGEQQRLAFARLLLHRPEVVFVDEPTASLDPANGEALLALLSVVADGGAIIVISTHDPLVRERVDATIDLDPSARSVAPVR